MEAARKGPPTMRSYSLEFGDDLRSPKNRREVMQDIKTKKPELVPMAFPRSPWSKPTYFQKDQAKVQERQDRERFFRTRGGLESGVSQNLESSSSRATPRRWTSACTGSLRAWRGTAEANE
eukprot:5912112-Pyramimonas_sp.AAC.1